jgi:hypothetical protein
MKTMFEKAVAAPGPLAVYQQQRRQQQWQRAAWATAAAAAALPPGDGSDKGPGPTLTEQQQALLLLPATGASTAAVQLDLKLWDGSRGWANCSTLWQQYIAYELSLGRRENARKVFLRAVHECPGFKGLWLSGFSVLSGGMQPRECSGLLNSMQEREVLVRVDVYEVLLAALAEQQQQQQQP